MQSAPCQNPADINETRGLPHPSRVLCEGGDVDFPFPIYRTPALPEARLMNPRRPPAPAGKLQFQLRAAIHLLSTFLIITRISIRVDPILIRVHRKIPIRQE